MPVGVTNENGALKSVAVVSPRHYRRTDPINAKQVVEYSHGDVVLGELMAEHDGLIGALHAAGVHVVEIDPNPLQPYALNVRDVAVVVGSRLVACAMGKEVRQTEPFWVIPQLRFVGDVHFLGAGSLEGGDVFVLEDACLVGVSERTNEAGIRSLEGIVDRPVVPVPLRPGVLHLDTAMNLVGETLVVAPDLLSEYSAFREMVRNLGIRHVEEIPAEDAWNLETNFFFLGPRRALAAESSTVGRELLEGHGVKVIDVPMTQHHRIGGSVRCATLPLERET